MKREKNKLQKNYKEKSNKEKRKEIIDHIYTANKQFFFLSRDQYLIKIHTKVSYSVLLFVYIDFSVKKKGNDTNYGLPY